MIYQKTILVGDKQLTINCSDLNCNWILVYNKDTALSVKNLENKKGLLETGNSIFEASSKEECIAEIKRLNLKVVDKDIEADLELLEPPVVKTEPKPTSVTIFDIFKLSAAN